MKRLLLIGISLLVVAFIGLSAGAVWLSFDSRTARFVQSTTKGALSLVGLSHDEAADGAPLKFNSTFLRLEGDEVEVPLSRKGAGGGLTEIEDGILLLAFDGSMFHATGPSDLEELSLEAPDNGFEAYQRDAEERFDDLDHRYYWFRYNDILALDAGEQRVLIASFTRYKPAEACYVNAVARLILPEGRIRELKAKAADWETLYETSPCLPLKSLYRALEGHTAGGRIAYDGVGSIYLGSGDYHFDGVYAAYAVSQDDTQEYGKVIEIPLDGSGHRVVSKGNRNMQGVAWLDGEVYAVEHGMRGGDELNRIVEGRDYGWPSVTLGTMYNKRPMPGTSESLGHHDGFEKPLFAWLPSVAISSLNPIEDVHPIWDGDLLMGTLGGKSLFRIRLEEGRVLFTERIPVGERVRYAQPTEGGVVLWTDSRKLIFLSPAELVTVDPLQVALDRMDLGSSERTTLEQSFNACRECHSLSPGEHGNAPSLALLFGRAIAASDFEGYSDALRGHGGEWSEKNLAAYISDPEAFAAGTVMPDPGIDDPEIIENMVTVIQKLSLSE